MVSVERLTLLPLPNGSGSFVSQMFAVDYNHILPCSDIYFIVTAPSASISESSIVH